MIEGFTYARLPRLSFDLYRLAGVMIGWADGAWSSEVTWRISFRRVSRSSRFQ